MPDAVKITVQNLSTTLDEADAEQIVAALDTQMTRDFNGSYWVTQGLAQQVDSVTLLAKGEAIPKDTWHMELLDTSNQEGALGYHEEAKLTLKAERSGLKKASLNSERGLREDNPSVPLMRVFVKTSQEAGANVGEVASHEALEAAVDPRPLKEPRTVTNTDKRRIYIVEVGDPVQETPYEIEGVMVANFALPAYFGYAQNENPTRYDWSSVLTAPFTLTPGGYISFAPEGTEAWEQEFGRARASASV